MRIAIVYSNLNSKKIEKYAKALGKGIESQANAVIDYVNIDTESDKRLTGYSYILLGDCKASLFNSRVSKSVAHFIKNCGQISGKHTYVYTTKGFGSQKYLTNLMRQIESQGVFLKNSDIIASEEDARIIGSKLHIK